MAGASWVFNAQVSALQAFTSYLCQVPFLGLMPVVGEIFLALPMKKCARGVLISLERSLYSEFD